MSVEQKPLRILDDLPNGTRFEAYGRQWRKLGPDSKGDGIPCYRLGDSDGFYRDDERLMFFYPQQAVFDV